MEPAAQASHPARRQPGIVVFGGGTATNSLVDIFERIRQQRGCRLSYVIPISDNGGSSSELIRVFGGPGIGDVRSRLVRLIPEPDESLEDPEERRAVRVLFNHRLSQDPEQARIEWLDVVEGRDRALWRHIASEKRELVRSIFNLANLEIVKRARPSSTFNFAKASIGNLFLTGARVFTGSLESAIYLLSTVCSIPSTVSTLPVINSNFTHHISAGLADGTVITGQNSISHPSAPSSLPGVGEDHHAGSGGGSGTDFLLPRQTTAHGGPASGGSISRVDSTTSLQTETEAHDRIEDATLPGSLPTLRKPYINFRKETPKSGSSGGHAGSNGEVEGVREGEEGVGKGTEEEEEDEQELPARIERIWYINPYGHEIRPVPNPKVLEAIHGASAVVYSIGSLYTSIMPSLILRGVGDAIAGTATGTATTSTTVVATPYTGGAAAAARVPRPTTTTTTSSTLTAAAAALRQQGQGHAQTHTQGPRYKILVLNSSNDRETGPRSAPFTAVDFVRAIARGAGAESRGEYYNRRPGATAHTYAQVAAVAHAPASISASVPTITTTVTGPTGAESGQDTKTGAEEDTEQQRREREEVRNYVTHLIYLEHQGQGGQVGAGAGSDAPRVDRDELSRLGVECIRVYGRRSPEDGVLRYDEAGLARALEAIIGGRPDVMARSRRNTSGQ